MPRGLKPTPHEIANFSEKLDFLISKLGISQAALAQQLNVTPPNISQWKESNHVPRTQIPSICKILSITREILFLKDIENFKNAVTTLYQTKVGTRWKAFVKHHAKDGLVLTTERTKGTPDRQISLKGVFKDPQRSSMQRLMLQKVKTNDKICFTLATSKAILSEWREIKGFVCLVEDTQGIHCLEYDDKFESQSHTSEYRIPANSKKWFHLGDPIGDHTCYLLMLSSAIPKTIQEYLDTGHIGSALEKLVIKLTKDKKEKFILKKLDFIVTG